MYNFFERIKAPLAEYKKKNPYKKDDDHTNNNNNNNHQDIESSVININSNSNSNNNNNSNNVKSEIIGEAYLGSNGAINIPSSSITGNTNMAPVPSLPISILKQSQLISSINPLGSSSPRGFYQNIVGNVNVGNHSQSPNHHMMTMIPQSPLINALNGSSTGIPVTMNNYNSNNTPNTTPQLQAVSSNVISVPMDIAEITSHTPITLLPAQYSNNNTSNTLSPGNSVIGSPMLNNMNNNNNNNQASLLSSNYNSSSYQSPSHYQSISSPFIQQSHLLPQSQVAQQQQQSSSYNHQMPSSAAAASASNISSPSISTLGQSSLLHQQLQQQQLLQHLQNLHQQHQNQYQPPQSPTLFTQQQQAQAQQTRSKNHLNSSSNDIELKEFKKSTGLNFSQLSSPRSFNNSNSNISNSGRHHFRSRSTDQYGYYNPYSLNQSTINVVSSATSNGNSGKVGNNQPQHHHQASHQHSNHQHHQHDQPQQYHIKSHSAIPINEINGVTNNNDGDDENVEFLKIPKIPKKKSRFNKEKMKKFKKSVYQILSPETQLPIHIVDNDQMENTVIPFLMELGRALLMSGVPAHRLEYELTLISGTFGIDGHFFTTPTGIFFSFGSPHTILSPYTHFLRINSTDYNMNRLILLEQLADQVIYGHVSCADGLVKLKEILRLKPLYNNYLTVISFVLSSFAISFFFKAGWVEVGACSFIGLYVGLLNAIASKYATVGRVLESLSACGGAILASLFNSFIYPVHIFMVTLGGIIALAPGLSLTLAVAEISTRNLISGNARLVGVFSSLLQLTFGIALGTRVSAKILPIQIEVSPLSLPSWTMFLAVPIAAISFAVQMKVHPRQIWVIMLASALGILCGNWGNKFFGDDVGSFFGSCAICALGNLYSRLSNTSAAVPIMSGIILLVPGSMGIKGLVSVSSGDIQSGAVFLESMFMISASLTIGLLVANLIVRPNKAL